MRTILHQLGNRSASIKMALDVLDYLNKAEIQDYQEAKYTEKKTS